MAALAAMAASENWGSVSIIVTGAVGLVVCWTGSAWLKIL